MLLTTGFDVAEPVLELDNVARPTRTETFLNSRPASYVLGYVSRTDGASIGIPRF